MKLGEGRMEARTRNRRRPVVAGLLFGVLSAVILWGVASGRQVVELEEGLRLEWLGVTEGTNALEDGSVIEKLFGDRIPANGIEVATIKLSRPRLLQAYEEDPTLNAWIRLRGSAVPKQNFRYYWEGTRAMTANRSGREITLPPPRPHGGRATNEMVVRVPLYAFPRDERTVRLRISAPNGDREEERWAEFEFKNPSYGKVMSWKPASLPITNVVGEHRFVLKEVSRNPTQIVFLLPSKNWYVGECHIADEEGNRSAGAGRTTKQTGTKEQIVGVQYSLEVNRTWKVSATFVGAPASALMGTSEVNEAALPLGERFLVTLRAGGGDAWLTNKSGTTYRCQFDGNWVSIGIPGARVLPYFVVIGATNEMGRGVGREMGPMASGLAWRHNGAETVQVWHARQACTNLVLHLVLPPVARTEYFLRPDQPGQR